MQQQHKNLQSPTALDLQSSLTTSSSSYPKPATMISSPDSAYDDNIGSDKRVNDIAATKSQSTSSSNNTNNNIDNNKGLPGKIIGIKHHHKSTKKGNTSGSNEGKNSKGS